MITYAEAVERFLAEKSVELSPHSVAHLRATLTKLGSVLASRPVDDVTYADLRQWVDELYLQYRPGTIRPMVGDVRQFWRWAKRRKMVKRNPAKRLRAPSSRLLRDATVNRAAPDADVIAVIRYLERRLERVVYRDLFGGLDSLPPSAWTYQEQLAIRDQLILVMLWETGARVGEMWRLSTMAMESATATPAAAYRVVSTGKTAAATLWFTEATAELWRVWNRVRPRPGGETYAVVAWRADVTPRPMDSQTISRTLARLCERAGVRPFRAHALRHAKARRATLAVGLPAASRLLGHSSEAVTAVYAAADDEQLSDAAVQTGLPFRLWK